MDRRKFLKMIGLGGAAVVTAPLLPEAPKVEDVPATGCTIEKYYLERTQSAEMPIMGSASYMPPVQQYSGGSVVFGAYWLPVKKDNDDA